MMLMMIMSIIFFLISNMLILLSNIMSKKMKINYEKMTPFESGFNPKSFNRMPLSLRFFMITIIFLIFDVEIALLLPMLPTLMLSKFMNWLVMMLVFMFILMVGLIYEWIQGALNWL